MIEPTDTGKLGFDVVRGYITAADCSDVPSAPRIAYSKPELKLSISKEDIVSEELVN
jgi:hypothetical protein